MIKYIKNLFMLIMFTFFLSGCFPISVAYQLFNYVLIQDYTLEENNVYEEIWKVDDGSFISGTSNSTIINGGDVFYYIGSKAFQGAYISSIQSKDGQEKWRTFVYSHSGGDFIYADGYLFFAGDTNPKIVSLNESGQILWKDSVWSKMVTDLNYADGRLFVYTSNSNFFEFNEQGENLLGRTYSSDRIFLIEDNQKYLWRVYHFISENVSTSEPIWDVEIGGLIQGKPVFDGDTIYFVVRRNGSNFFSLNKETGAVNWKKEYYVISNLCVMESKIYFIDYDGYLVEIDKSTGELLTKVKINPEINVSQRSYYLAGDSRNNILALGFPSRSQIIGLKIKNP